MTKFTMSTRHATSPKSAERRAERRDAILEVATRLFAKEGYADCDMGRVAAEIGVAKGTLYLYFPSKEKLFYAVVDAGMKAMQESIRADASQAKDGLDRICRAIYSYLKFFDEHPDLVELLIHERASFKKRKRPTYFEHRDANRGVWRELYQSLIDDGKLRDDLPVERLLDTVGSLLYGTMFINYFIGRSVTLAEQYEAIIQIVFRGILSDEERRKCSRHGL